MEGWADGSRGGADDPVNRADVNAIAPEAMESQGKGLYVPQKPAVDILGREFALELNETVKEVAVKARGAAAFQKISRKVLENKAVEQRAGYFFELGAT